MFFINSIYGYAIFPLGLIESEMFSNLSSNEKILYTLLLNRTNYSRKNKEKFTDSNGVFIFYSCKQIQKHLNCSVKTAVNSLDNLQQAGLIRKEYQKRGLPLKIYVNDVFGMHKDTYKPKTSHTPNQNFKPHSPAIKQNDVSFDVERAKETAKKHRENFAEKKKRRSVNSTF